MKLQMVSKHFSWAPDIDVMHQLSNQGVILLSDKKHTTANKNIHSSAQMTF